MNALIRRQAGRVPVESPPEEQPAPQPVDLGAGPRAPVQRSDPHAAMGRWIRERHGQLVTRAQNVVIPSRRSRP